MYLGLVIGILLVVMLAGYLVLVKAHSQKGGLKTIGQIISWIVIITAFAGTICTTAALHCRKGKSKKGYWHKCGLYPKECPLMKEKGEEPAKGKK